MEAALSTLPLETLETYREEALTFHHRLLTGQILSYSAHAGHQKTKKIVNVADSEAYLAALGNAIASKADANKPLRGPIYPGMGFTS